MTVNIGMCATVAPEGCIVTDGAAPAVAAISSAPTSDTTNTRGKGHRPANAGVRMTPIRTPITWP